MRTLLVRWLLCVAVVCGTTIGSVPDVAAWQEKAKKPKKKKKARKPKPQISKAPPDVQNEVVAVLTAYTKALAARDAKAAGEIYTDDITIWGARRLKGREAVDRWLKDFTSNRVVQMTLRDMLVRTIAPDMVTVLGIWDSHVEWDDKGAPRSVDAKDGSFLYVMVKQGGKWKVQTALVSRQVQPAVAAAAPPADQPKAEDAEEEEDEEEEGPSTAGPEPKTAAAPGEGRGDVNVKRSKK